MITTLILICFAFIYWMFSVFLVATLVTRSWTKDFDIPKVIIYTILMAVISPILVPILLGLHIGNILVDMYKL